ANIFNEYYAFVRGLDNDSSVRICGTIVRDGIMLHVMLRLVFLYVAVAFLLVVYIRIVSSWWIGEIGAACMLIGSLYYGGPLPIAYTPLGEICSGILMGTIMIAISYFIQTGHVDANVILVSIPVAIFIETIMLSN